MRVTFASALATLRLTLGLVVADFVAVEACDLRTLAGTLLGTPLIGNNLTIGATAEERLAVRVGFVAASTVGTCTPCCRCYVQIRRPVEVISLQLLVVHEVVVLLGEGAEEKHRLKCWHCR